MATTAISISSNALVLLGDQPIASFNEGDTGSLLAAQLYETTYHTMLTDTLWHFATRTAILAQVNEVPENGWKYEYALPEDCLYCIETDQRHYELYERSIYANSSTLQINYIYPVDEVNLPPFFAKALEYNLASLFAIPLTGNASRAEFYRELYKEALSKARRADASQRPASQVNSYNRYIEVRNV